MLLFRSVDAFEVLYQPSNIDYKFNKEKKQGKAWLRPTHRSLCFKELANAVPQLVKEHGVECRTKLQSQQVLHISADVEANTVMAAHQQGQESVQEAADGRLAGGR